MQNAEHLPRWTQRRAPLDQPSAILVQRKDDRSASSAPIEHMAPAIPLLRLDTHRCIDYLATSDARSDVAAGGSQLHDGMEQLFSNNDITQTAWARYCHIYLAEQSWLLSHVAAADEPL